MKCLHCGYCCKNYWTAIVDDPLKGIDESNLIMHKGDGTPCKHLEGDKVGEYKCGIHHYPWYDQTPCYEFTQVESSVNDECRMGRYIIDQIGLREKEAPESISL